MGSSVRIQPAGTETAGKPVRLKRRVKRLSGARARRHPSPSAGSTSSMRGA